MPTFETVPDESPIRALVRQVADDNFPELKEYGVRITILLAHATRDERTGEPKGPALRLHGYPAAATIKVTSHEARAAGHADCILKLDGDRWEEFSPTRQAALIHHELEHLEFVVDDEGHPKTDDLGRPRLKMRLHDHQVGIFTDVVEKYGKESIDAELYVELHKVMQQKFPWG